MQTGTKLQPDAAQPPDFSELPALEGALRPADISTVERLRVLWRERRFLARAGATGLAFGLILAFVLPKRFRSTTQLMPPDNQSSSGMAMFAALAARTGSGLGGVAGDLLGIKSSGALFIGILRSRTVEDRLIEQFDLKKVYWTSSEPTARQELEENTATSEDRKSGIITITVTDRDPQRAAAMAEAYVLELDRIVAQLSTSSARREREFLEGRLKAVQADLESAEKEFSQFSSKNNTIDIKEQGRAMVEAAATLEGQLIAAKSELQGLKQIYTDNNVRVRSAEARIQELQGQLNKLAGKGESTTTIDSGEQPDQVYPSIRKLPLLGVTFADLYRRTRVQEAVYEALTQQYELAKVEEVKETPSVKVLDEARVPERKSFPPRGLIIFLSTFFACAAAAVFILGKAHWTELDDANPGKVLASEVFQTVRSSLPWTSSNGAGPRAPVTQEFQREVLDEEPKDRAK